MSLLTVMFALNCSQEIQSGIPDWMRDEAGLESLSLSVSTVKKGLKDLLFESERAVLSHSRRGQSSNSPVDLILREVGEVKEIYSLLPPAGIKMTRRKIF